MFGSEVLIGLLIILCLMFGMMFYVIYTFDKSIIVSRYWAIIMFVAALNLTMDMITSVYDSRIAFMFLGGSYTIMSVLLLRADHAMYSAKDSGRNRIVVCNKCI